MVTQEEINEMYSKIYNEEPSYKWFVEKYPNFKLDTPTISSTGELFGTVNMPTGTGKTGIVFEDIIYRIMEAIETKTPLIVHLCSPRLMLNQQIAQNLIYVIIGILYTKYPDSFNEYISFYNNSSDKNANAFKLFRLTYTPINNIENIGKINTLVKIVVSCNDSVNNFFKYLNKAGINKNNTNIVTYFDESHTLNVVDKNSKNNRELNIKKFCELSSAVYAISATPNAKITCMINNYSKYRSKYNNWTIFEQYDDPYMICLSASDAIRKGLIVAPYIDLWKVNTNEITPDVVYNIYNTAHDINKDIKYHKILITCPTGNNATDNNADEIEEKKLSALFTSLVKKYKKELKEGKLKIFATTSTTGKFSAGIENGMFNDHIKYADAKSFTSAIDNAECDCIVLHIRQMIEGIDISSLTQIVMYLDNINVNTNLAATIIQTNGRCMRSASGERGIKNMAKRTKKFGICSFVINDKNSESLQIDIEDFFYRTYLLDKIHISIHDCEHTGRKVVRMSNPRKQRIEKLITKENSPLAIDVEEFINNHKAYIKMVGNADDVIKYAPALQNIVYKFKNTYMLFNKQHTIDYIKEKLNALF